MNIATSVIFLKNSSLKEESSGTMSGREGNSVDFDPGVLQPAPV